MHNDGSQLKEWLNQITNLKQFSIRETANLKVVVLYWYNFKHNSLYSMYVNIVLSSFIFVFKSFVIYYPVYWKHYFYELIDKLFSLSEDIFLYDHYNTIMWTLVKISFIWIHSYFKLPIDLWFHLIHDVYYVYYNAFVWCMIYDVKCFFFHQLPNYIIIILLSYIWEQPSDMMINTFWYDRCPRCTLI